MPPRTGLRGSYSPPASGTITCVYKQDGNLTEGELLLMDSEVRFCSCTGAQRDFGILYSEVQSISQGDDDEVLLLCGSEALCFSPRGNSAAGELLSTLQTRWMEWMRWRHQQQQQQDQEPQQQAPEQQQALDKWQVQPLLPSLPSLPPPPPQEQQHHHHHRRRHCHQDGAAAEVDDLEPEECIVAAAAASGVNSIYLNADSMGGAGTVAGSAASSGGARGRQCIECWENQRWYPLTGWSAKLMLTDRPAWSDEAGLVEKTKYSFDFLDLDLEGLNAVAGRGAAAGGMEWELAWAVDKTRPDADPDGWLYAVDFPSAWGIRTTATCVRRRKWVPAPQASASSASAACPFVFMTVL